MKTIDAVLFDVDGVLALPPRLFSEIYSKEYGVDLEKLTPFYHSTDFKNALVGKADLKQLIIDHADKWQWHKDPQQLLDLWFAGEHVLNTELLAIVERLRDLKIPLFLATNQEKYRAAYIQETMFPGLFDGAFVSSGIGYVKEQTEFWTQATKQLADITGRQSMENVYFFDDTQSCVDAAARAGIQATLFKTVQQVPEALGLDSAQ